MVKIPPEIRILPLNDSDEDFHGRTLGQIQQQFFLRDLPNSRRGRFRFPGAALKSPPGTVVLFQLDSQIIASGRLIRVERFQQPTAGYRGALHFECGSIRVFDPVKAEAMRAIWPEFNRFGNAKLRLNGSTFPAFMASLKSVASPFETTRVTFFNNCKRRDHIKIYGSGAFFDLSRTGKQGRQALGLTPCAPCVVAKSVSDDRVEFSWYAFEQEVLLPDENDVEQRAFFGKLRASESLSKADAAESVRYRAFFKENGHFKNGSVFRGNLALAEIPEEMVDSDDPGPASMESARTGAGFGDSVQNKLVEAAATRVVIESYERTGWQVESVERNRCGYDFNCTRSDVVEHVEVKGIRSTEQRFIITKNEVERAKSDPHFVLQVVTSALSESPMQTRYIGREFCEQFDRVAVQYAAFLRSPGSSTPIVTDS